MDKLSNRTHVFISAFLILSGFFIVSISLWDSTIGNSIEAVEQERISKDIFTSNVVIRDIDNADSYMTIEEPTSESDSVVAVSDEPALADKPEYGEVFAKLYVPRFGEDYVRVIAEGTSSGVLNKAVGHYVTSALPWDEGNFALAAHRTTRGASFLNIDKLVDGDKSIVETVDAYYVYEYVNTVVVSPNESSVLLDVPPQFEGNAVGSILTFTSCHPKYSSAERIVAFSVLLGVYDKDSYALEDIL